MKVTKSVLKKIIGYISSIIVLIFLGEPIVSGVGEVADIMVDQSAKTDSYSYR